MKREPHRVVFLRLPLELAMKLDARLKERRQGEFYYRGLSKQEYVVSVLEHELRDVVSVLEHELRDVRVERDDPRQVKLDLGDALPPNLPPGAKVPLGGSRSMAAAARPPYLRNGQRFVWSTVDSKYVPVPAAAPPRRSASASTGPGHVTVVRGARALRPKRERPDLPTTPRSRR